MKKYLNIQNVVIVILLFACLGFVANAQGEKIYYSIGELVVRAFSTPQEFLNDGGKWGDIKPFPATVCDEASFGSVGVSDEYNSTSTIVGSTNVDTLIKKSSGVLGSVIITTAGNTEFLLLNATTTDATKRAAKYSTSTITLAQFPPSATVGTYVYDVNFSVGLYFDVTAGAYGSSTITYR